MEIFFSGCFSNMSRHMTKPTKCWIRSEDPDQSGHPPSLISLCCPLEEPLHPWLHTKHPEKTLISLGRCPGWSVFAECTGHFVGFVMRWRIYFLLLKLVVQLAACEIWNLTLNQGSWVWATAQPPKFSCSSVMKWAMCCDYSTFCSP